MIQQQDPIILFPGVEILPTLTMQYTKEYLNRYCTIDVLGDTLYVKKLGNDKTTYAIDFVSGEISKIRKIKDETGHNLDDGPIFENDDNDSESADDDDIDYNDL
ncbi:MAG: hypothetical protein HRU07_05690 [Nitrosopumilus sp.]|nr:hypothetical protein [Nitrosopumilus sp.]NRA05638.1 hypothetical protein [Nitrosopumilus sp.]